MRLGVPCWLVVRGVGFASGYGGNKKVRVSVRDCKNVRERLW